MNKYKVTRKCGDTEHVTTIGAISKMSAIDGFPPHTRDFSRE